MQETKKDIELETLKTVPKKNINKETSKDSISNEQSLKEDFIKKQKTTNKKIDENYLKDIISKEKNKNLKLLEDKKFLVIGTGAFGTAVASFLIKRNKYVSLYGVDQKEINDINLNSKNSKYYSNVELPKNLKASNDLEKSLKDVDVILFAIPSSVFLFSLNDVISKVSKPAYFISLTKGMEYIKQDIFSRIMKDSIPQELNLGVLKLSGPSFAEELVTQVPTSFILSSFDIKNSTYLKKYFETNYTKITATNHIEAVDMASIIKNPMAILLGIASGLGYKKNAMATMFINCLEEMKNFIRFYTKTDLGAYEITYSAVGLGDLFLTGTSKKSRNFLIGRKIGISNRVNKKIFSSITTIEGLRSLQTIISFGEINKINFKLLKLLYNIIYNDLEPKKVLDNYLNGRI